MDAVATPHVLILGLGVSGLAMVRWCARLGWRVTVADTRAAPPQADTLRQELPQVRLLSAPLDAALLEGLEGVDAVYKSPGIAPQEMAALQAAAHARGVPVRGELSLFAQALRELQVQQGYAPKVLAVTGTNGKTTVTSLTGHLLRWADWSVAVAGNIGPTLLDTLRQALEQDALPQAWVLELSSFQLDGVEDFEPTAAVVLNVTQDHLDWHADMADYAQAKARVFGQQGLMVLNREDAAVMQMLGTARAVASAGADKPTPVRGKPQPAPQRAHVCFGADLPRRGGDFGLEEVNGMVWLVRAHAVDETLQRRRGAAQEEELHIQRLMPADALRIRGRHNATNALAALALCSAAGCALAPLLYGLREYRGEPHRVEPVAVVQDVEYFDDSKGTNVGATAAALRGLGADRRVVLILGGVGKGQDFSPLAPLVAAYARAVLLIGVDAPAIRAALADTGVPLEDAADMAAAVALAHGRAHAGDAVLLSPACASFDMFRHYEHRAEVFVQAVRALALAHGDSLEGMGA